MHVSLIDMLGILRWFVVCTVAFYALVYLWVAVGAVAEELRLRSARRHREKFIRRAMTLLVAVDGDRVSPSIQLRGDPLPKNAVLRLEVIDPLGTRRHLARRAVSPAEMNREICFPQFSPKGGTSAQEIASWRWKVAIKVGRRVLQRWSERLSAMDGLNAEAEIDHAIV